MPPENNPPFDPTDVSSEALAKEGHLLPAAKKSGAGPIVGTIIIIVLLIIGALYFWGARLNNQQNPPPYIPADNSTTGA